MPTILLLSGPLASGKTRLADELIARERFKRVKSSEFLKRLHDQRGETVSRSSLQQLGDNLDVTTDYRWLIDDVAKPQMSADPEQERWIVDSVRKDRQISHFRASFGSNVYHVHVWAPEQILKLRFDERLASGRHSEGRTSYAEAISHPNEVSARGLKDIADVSIDLSSFALEEAVALIVKRFPRRN